MWGDLSQGRGRPRGIETHKGCSTMLQFEGKKGVEFCDGLTRRDFLKAGALGAGAVSLSLADLATAGANPKTDVNCILLFLVGGPGQLDTWDLKPEAPDSIRGPFQPIRTNVPGIDICEHFPLMARLADRACPLGPSPAGADPRDRPPADADGPAVSRRDRVSSLRSCRIAFAWSA